MAAEKAADAINIVADIVIGYIINRYLEYASRKT